MAKKGQAVINCLEKLGENNQNTLKILEVIAIISTIIISTMIANGYFTEFNPELSIQVVDLRAELIPETIISDTLDGQSVRIDTCKSEIQPALSLLFINEGKKRGVINNLNLKVESENKTLSFYPISFTDPESLLSNQTIKNKEIWRPFSIDPEGQREVGINFLVRVPKPTDINETYIFHFSDQINLTIEYSFEDKTKEKNISIPLNSEDRNRIVGWYRNEGGECISKGGVIFNAQSKIYTKF